jgi:tetratricopeptide (TPR) repeat protein
MLIEGGDFSKAADISLTLNDKKKAAELYEKNGEYLKAASLWVELENNDLAADAYVKSNEPEKAAHYYEKAGKWNKAGECYLNLLKYNKAAECFNSAGNYLQAAQIYYNLKNLDRTINMLQKIQKDKAEYRQAAFLLGKIFHQQKFYNLAKIKLNESISDDAVNTENIEAYYIMADCHSKLGEFADGIKLYDLILSFDFNYRDVLPLRELALKDKSELKQIESHYEETGVIRDLLQLQEGDIISKRFKIEKEIGSGGMGKVYKAFDSELEETVAIKILFTQFGEYEDEKKNLVNEIKIARKITHASVIKVYDIGDWLGNKFFTMQYVDGIDLGEWFQINLQADVKEKSVLFKKICEGLKAAHDIGVIHRDIKPRNILVNKDNNPMLLDFGIAEAFNAYLRITENKLIGSPDYMSPEQISNLAYDQRTDIYSLGCVMYEMFTGRKPYISDDLTHLFMAKLDHDPRPPSVFNPKIPTELEKIITKAMQKNPKNRYSNIAEMISDINLFLAT